VSFARWVPSRAATLVNTHAHLDHICNNDLIVQVQAAERHHCMGRGGTTAAALDAPRYFAAQFDQMDIYADPFTSYPINRATSPVGYGPGGLWARARARSCFSRLVPTATTTSWSTFPSTICCAWVTSASRSSPPGRAEIEQLLETILADHESFERVLAEELAATDGLTPAELYARFCDRVDEPVVGRYQALEFPRTPASLQNIIVTTLLQLGYDARGPRRHKRFYRTSSTSI
jgi:hypothetical protein